ncbi:MAG: MFS transporter [Chloroflexi bacterium]|nr:MFS transporter [Chloroflexota bacterium]MYD47122.1 MFS transporter [Chloroflexota bacterium]
MAPSPAASATRTTPRGWAVLLLNRLHYSSVVLSSFAFGLFLPFIQADLKLSYLEIGVLQGVWWATSALFLVPFSALLGRFDPNRRVLAALALLTPLVLTQGLALGFWTLLASRFLTVLTHAAMAPARPLLLRRWAAPQQYATITSVGLSVHSTWMAATLTFSPLLIVALASWRLAYFLQASLLAIQLIIWAFITRNPPPPLEPEPPSPPASENPNSALSLISTLRAYPHAWLLGCIMLCLSASWTTVLTFLPTILETERGIAISAGSILFGFLYYALIPGAPVGSRIFKYVTNRRLMVLLPAIFNTAFTVAALLSDNFTLAALALTGLGLVWVFVPAMEVLPFEFAGIAPRQVSMLTALVLTFSAVGFGAGPVLAGAVAQAADSLTTGVLTVAALTSLGIMAATLFPPRPGALN